MKKNNSNNLLQLFRGLLLGVLLCSYSIIAQAEKNTEDAMPDAGHLTLTGSTALSNLMTYWVQAFAEQNPSITVNLVDTGDISGIDALINGSADIVLISTRISDKEIQEFEQRYHYGVHVIPVAMDALDIYVNGLNPLQSITLQDLDAIYSSTFRCHEKQAIKTWGELDVEGTLAKQRISLYGLTTNTGAASLFKQKALCGGDFNQNFQALAGPSAVEDALMTDINGIGFSSSAMRSEGTHSLAIAANKTSSAIQATPEAIRSGLYPMSRTLGIAINKPIKQPFSPALQAFIDFLLSQEGQSVVNEAGYVSLPHH